MFSAIPVGYESKMAPANAKMFRLSLIEREDGFTLNEILVSIALIAIGVLGFSVNTIGVIQGNQISGNVTVATGLAQDKLEQLKVLGTALPTCPTATTAGCFDGPLNSQGAPASPGNIYHCSWVITPNTPATELSRIVVTVSWRDYLSRQVELSTLVYTG